MPDLDFKITGVRAASRGIVPLLQFTAAIKNLSGEVIRSVLLHAQIQIQCPQRPYNSHEKENLVELFGAPERWGQTLRNRPWISTNTNVPGFECETETLLLVPCTYDLMFAATKYFYGLEGGDVPLLFLFSGTVFYSSENGPIQTQLISWNKESVFRMEHSVWANMMQEHYPNSAWIYMRRDVFDRMYALKRANGDATWEQTIERLLSEPKSGNLEPAEVHA